MISRTVDFAPGDGGPSQSVVVTIAMPEPDPLGQDFRALVRIEALGKVKEQYVYGVDGVQAIVEALWLMPTLLSTALPKGRLTFLGDEHLGFEHRST